MTDVRPGDGRVGDPAVDAAWRRASDERPPARVDDAILAAARAEVRAAAPPRVAPQPPSWWIRWQPLAAAAGVVGLAFVLVLLVPREEAARAPAPAGRPEASATDAVQTKATARPVAEVPQTTEASASADAQAAAEAEAAAPPAPRPVTATRDAGQIAAESGAALAGAARPAAARSAVAPESPEAWARRVADLHAQGDTAAAAAELTAFRQAFPNADEYLPPALSRWAASVPGAESR